MMAVPRLAELSEIEFRMALNMRSLMVVCSRVLLS